MIPPDIHELFRRKAEAEMRLFSYRALNVPDDPDERIRSATLMMLAERIYARASAALEDALDNMTTAELEDVARKI